LAGVLFVNKHCHNPAETMELPQGKKRLVLVGNPNVGKSVFEPFVMFGDIDE